MRASGEGEGVRLPAHGSRQRHDRRMSCHGGGHGDAEEERRRAGSAGAPRAGVVNEVVNEAEGEAREGVVRRAAQHSSSVGEKGRADHAVEL